MSLLDKYPTSYAMRRHRPGACPTANVCHCLVVESETFYTCCGWYHDACGGRVRTV